MVKVTIEKDGKLSREIEGKVLFLIVQGEPGKIKAGVIGKANGAGDIVAAMSIGMAEIVRGLDLEPAEKKSVRKNDRKICPRDCGRGFGKSGIRECTVALR